MGKIFDITDNSELYDGKVLHIVVDGPPGEASTVIRRTYGLVTFGSIVLSDTNGFDIGINTFSNGDLLHIRYDSTPVPLFTLVSVKSKKESSLKNGLVEAGYLNSEESTSNSQEFVIPGGAVIGRGGLNSTEGLSVLGAITVGEPTSPVTLTKPYRLRGYDPTGIDLPIDSFSIGKPLRLSNNRTIYIGDGFGNQVYRLSTDPVDLAKPLYDPDGEVTLALTDLSFDGVETKLNVNLTEYDVTTFVLFDLYIDGVKYDRYEGVIDPSRNADLFTKVNMPVIILDESSAAAVVKIAILPSDALRYLNSVAIGNSAFVSKNNQIVLGSDASVVGAGFVDTDYSFKSTAAVEGDDVLKKGVSLDIFDGFYATAIDPQTFTLADTVYPILVDTIDFDGNMSHPAFPASEFTCNVAGKYDLFCQIILSDGISAHVTLWFEVDTGAGFTVISNSPTLRRTGYVTYSTTGSELLSIGDKVRAVVSIGAAGFTTTQPLLGAPGVITPTTNIQIKRIGA